MSLLSTLVMTIYLGLIPLILMAGAVMAVRKRHRLGPRASKQLVTGAVVLLAAHALTALRPLLRDVLRDVIVERDPTVLGNVADVTNALSLVQLVAQAAGAGLIIAAVFAARPLSPAVERSPDPS